METRLTEKQLQIVHSTAQRLIIEAQPGSGKTRILVERLVATLKGAYGKPGTVVAITFTEKAAQEIRKRVLAHVEYADKLWISTIHGFCYRILKEQVQYQWTHGMSSDFSILTSEQALFLKDQAIRKGLEELLSSNDKTLVHLLTLYGYGRFKGLLFSLLSSPISLLGQSQPFPPLFKDIMYVFDVINVHYQSEKTKRNSYDFDDLLSKCCDLFHRHEDVLNHYRKLFNLIMVDEFQDTNFLQKEIIELLTTSHSNGPSVSLMVVGDPKQSIYRFRGADVGLFYDVKKDILQNEGFCFEMLENFRSSPNLIEFVNTLFRPLLNESFQASLPAREMALNGNDLVEYWHIEKDKDDDAALFSESRRIKEAQWLAKYLKKIKKKTSWSEIAILFRAMTFSHLYESALDQEGIPWVRTDAGYLYESREVHELLALLKWALDPSDHFSLWRVLSSPWSGISSQALAQLSMYRAQKNISLEEVLRNGYEIFFDPLKKLAEIARKMSLERQPTRLSLEEWYRGAPLQYTVRVKKFLMIVREFESHNKDYQWGDFLQYIEALQEHSVVATEPPQEITQDAVRLLTIHQSKGLEFDMVFIPDLSYSPHMDSPLLRVDKKLGIGLKMPAKSNPWKEDLIYTEIKKQSRNLEQAESKRLFYVAATRAKNKLILSHSSVKPRAASWAHDIEAYKHLLSPDLMKEGVFI